MKMKILNISLDKKLFENNSNVKERVLDYAKIFERFDILVLASGEKLELGNMAIWPVGSFSKFLAIFKAYFEGKKMIKKYQHGLISSQDPFFTGLVGWFLKKKTGLPLQIQIHTDFLSPYFRSESLMNKIRARLAAFLLQRADGIRVVSERIKKSLELNIPELTGKITIIPIFVDIKKIKNAPPEVNLRGKYPQFDFLVLMASRLTKEKNIPLAIEAFKEVAKSYPKAGLLVVGEGPENNNLKFKILNLKLSNKIMLEPWVEDLSSYYKTADLFLLTSNYEGYGLAIIEAMACGLPVIMTDVGCAGEIMENKESGLVVPVNVKRELEEAILKLIDNVELRKQLGENAARVTDGLFSKEKILDLYKKSSEVFN